MIEALLRTILAEPGVRRLEPGGDEPAWAEPSVGERLRLGFPVNSRRLCQTGAPRQARIPVR